MRFKFLFGRSGKMSLPLRLSLMFSILFLVGVFAGVLMAIFLNLPAKQALFSDLNGFIYGEHTEISFWQSLWQVSRIPLLIFCLSFTCFGVLVIPVVVALQGYLLSFSVSVMIRLLGWQGCVLGLANFGVRTFVLVPCLLILSVQCFLLSKHFFQTMLPSNKNGVTFPRGFILTFICCFLLLPLGAALDHALTEHAVSLVLDYLIL